LGKIRDITAELDDQRIVETVHLTDLAQGNFGQSLRQARPAMDVVMEAFVWTFWLAAITMVLVKIAAIVIGSLAAFRVGGVLDRLATFFSLIGAAAP
ncbi:hypothetical protein AB9E13_33470, partial [Rhizobium leguminosarum]